MYKDILLAVDERVATITINRPQVSNALSKNSYFEILNAIERCESDERAGAVVITGAGRNFSAGGDISSFKKLIDSGTYLQQESIIQAGYMSRKIRLCSKPVIAMINGVATGAGLSIALACDFRIAAPSSKLIMGFIRIGLSGDTGSIYFLNKLVGSAKAAELIMTGTPISGEGSLQIGLVTKLAKEGALQEETYAFARNLANGPLVALKKQKELINKYFYAELDAFSKDEAEAMAVCSRTADFAEAVNAFLDKRPPKFTGK